MKKLLLFIPEYQRLFNDYQVYLKLLGYHKTAQKNMAAHVKEFLHQLERQQINRLQDVAASQITDHCNHSPIPILCTYSAMVIIGA